MSTIKRFWNNIVRPSLNDALDRFDSGDDRPEDDPEEQTPTRRRNAEANVSTLEQEVAESERRLEEARRRLQAARQSPPPATPNRPDPAQATTRPASAQAQAERPRRATSGRDPFLEEAERELDEALKRYQNNVTQPNPAANAQARQRANFSDDDAARWVAEQQASRGAQGQQAKRPQSGQQAAPRANNQIPQHYAILRLPNGSTLQQVKDAYRKLMRDNHPDRFTNDPVRHRQATEVSQKLSRAYMELRRHLGDIR